MSVIAPLPWLLIVGSEHMTCRYLTGVMYVATVFGRVTLPLLLPPTPFCSLTHFVGALITKTAAWRTLPQVQTRCQVGHISSILEYSRTGSMSTEGERYFAVIPLA
jgi:hypothetical protein